MENSKEVAADKGQSFIDVIHVKNLIAGRTYKFKGTLKNKVNGETIKDAAGKEVVAERTFTTDDIQAVEITASPNAFNFTTADGTLLDMAADHANYLYSGDVELEFKGFDFSNLNNVKGVVFEEVTLIKDGKETKVGEHKDITDVDQFIIFSEVHTSAKDVDTDSKVVPRDTVTTLKDEVEYKNLIPGKKYTLVATLHVKNDISGKYKDGDSLKTDGEEVTVEHEFIPQTPDGTETVEISLDTGNLPKMQIVVFEKLKNSFGIEVGMHCDINDDKQTLNVPDGHTTATDDETKDHVSNAAKKVTITDIVYYENLEPDKEYEVTGTLYVKEKEEPLRINGKTVTVTKKFTPKKSDGTVEIKFTIDASELKGQTFVAFEKVKRNGITVFVHENIDDEEQTIHVPDGHTTAIDKDTQDHVSQSKKTVTIVDKVYYENLVFFINRKQYIHSTITWRPITKHTPTD